MGDDFWLPSDLVDENQFKQILDMDDDDERQFSKQTYLDFKHKAQTSCEGIQSIIDQDAIPDEKLRNIRAVAESLKAAAQNIGFVRIIDQSRVIELYAQRIEGEHEPKSRKSDDELLGLIEKRRRDVVEACRITFIVVNRFFGVEDDESEEA